MKIPRKLTQPDPIATVVGGLITIASTLGVLTWIGNKMLGRPFTPDEVGQMGGALIATAGAIRAIARSKT